MITYIMSKEFYVTASFQNCKVVFWHPFPILLRRDPGPSIWSDLLFSVLKVTGNR